MVTLEFGKLYVKGEGTDVFEVQVGVINEDMFLEVWLIPNEVTRQNCVEEEGFFVDILNETVTEHLENEGFVVINKKGEGNNGNRKIVCSTVY